MAVQADEGHAGNSPGESHAETSLDRIANQYYPLLNAKILNKDERIRLADPLRSLNADLSRSSAPSEDSTLDVNEDKLRRPESSTSSITGVDTPDDLGVDDNTDPNSYPSLLCVGLEVLCCILVITERGAKMK